MPSQLASQSTKHTNTLPLLLHAVKPHPSQDEMTTLSNRQNLPSRHPPEHLNLKENNLKAITDSYNRFYSLDEIDRIDDPNTELELSNFSPT